MRNWKYGIVLKENLTSRESALFDVVVPGRNGRLNENGDIVYDLKYDHYVSVEALNWDSRHDKIVNDARDAFNLSAQEPVTERVITAVAQRRLLGK